MERGRKEGRQGGGRGEGEGGRDAAGKWRKGKGKRAEAARRKERWRGVKEKSMRIGRYRGLERAPNAVSFGGDDACTQLPDVGRLVVVVIVALVFGTLLTQTAGFVSTSEHSFHKDGIAKF